MTTLVIVQARLGSTRLPGKTLMDIGGHPCLWHVMERVKRAQLPYILTIPAAVTDDALAEYATAQGYPLSRGPHPDVLTAFRRAWQDAGVLADSIVRVTADCPFVQPKDIRFYAGVKTYVSNAHPVRMVGKGLDVEGFGVGLLLQADKQAADAEDRHHVTPYMRRALDLATSTDDGEFRVTLDTPTDLAVLRHIAGAINVQPPHPTVAELRAYFTSHSGIHPGT